MNDKLIQFEVLCADTIVVLRRLKLKKQLFVEGWHGSRGLLAGILNLMHIISFAAAADQSFLIQVIIVAAGFFGRWLLSELELATLRLFLTHYLKMLVVKYEWLRKQHPERCDDYDCKHDLVNSFLVRYQCLLRRVQSTIVKKQTHHHADDGWRASGIV